MVWATEDREPGPTGVSKLPKTLNFLSCVDMPALADQSPSSRRNLVQMSPFHVRRDKVALFQRVEVPPGDRSSRKQPEQAWR